MFGNYSKLAGQIIGSVVGIVIVAVAFKVPSVATCTMPGVAETCTLLGMTQAQITAAVVALMGAIGVHQSAANVPIA